MPDHVSIESLYQTDSLREKETIEQIEVGNNIEGQITGLWYCNQTFFLHHLKYEKYDDLKLDAYRCARLDEFLVTHFDSRILDYGINHITYALLSDDKELIKRYANLGHKVYMWMVERGHSTPMYCIQQIMKSDWEQVKWSLEIMKTKNVKMAKAIQPDLRFFEGILEKDENKMRDAVIQLLKNHKKRNGQMGIAQDYISVPALTYAKLAWLQGIEIEIDHPLVPKELLPIRPLDNYDDKYDFLKAN